MIKVNRFICINWLVSRVITNPAGLGYRCSEFALWQVIPLYRKISIAILSTYY